MEEEGFTLWNVPRGNREKREKKEKHLNIQEVHKKREGEDKAGPS